MALSSDRMDLTASGLLQLCVGVPGWAQSRKISGANFLSWGLNRKAPEVTDLSSPWVEQEAPCHGTTPESSGLSPAFQQVAGLADW